MFTIGQAAAQIGVEPHVLRHWEHAGALAPERDSAGRRKYSAQHVNECTHRIVSECPECAAFVSGPGPKSR